MDQDTIVIIALLISLIALLISVGQLLQSIFCTAEGFRRANKETMSVFAQSRDRRFHLTELRYETVFSTPHFTFHNPVDENSPLSGIPDGTASMVGDHVRPILAITSGSDTVENLRRLVTLSTHTSRLQRFLNLFDRQQTSANHQLILPGVRFYAAGWLKLLEQLYEDEERFSQNGCGASYTFMRSGRKNGRSGPDKRQVRYPAIECHGRSWDFLPPDIVRPLASIGLGDGLTLCYRLRITISKLNPKSFKASGFGHSFWSTNIQNLGVVIHYGYDRTNYEADVELPGDVRFIPSEDADKLAFGIIPKNELLGIKRDWPLLQGSYKRRNLTDTMKSHFKDVGVSAERLIDLMSDHVSGKNDAWQTFGDSLLVLAPFLPIDGLGLVQYQPPIPTDWVDSVLWKHEGRTVLLNRLAEIAPKSRTENIDLADMPRPIDLFKAKELHWIGHVLDFFETRYYNQFHSVPGSISILEKNAPTPKAQTYLQQLRSTYEDADRFLGTLFNQAGAMPTYQYLVAAHHEMAIAVHAEIERQIRETLELEEEDGNSHGSKAELRNGTDSLGVRPKMIEAMHQYINLCLVGGTIVEIYREKTKHLVDLQDRRPANLSDEQIRYGWCTMMLRGCLWGMTHHPIWLPGLPYPSQLWKDSTVVLIQ